MLKALRHVNAGALVSLTLGILLGRSTGRVVNTNPTIQYHPPTRVNLRFSRAFLNVLEYIFVSRNLIVPPLTRVDSRTAPGARFSKLPVITGPVKLFCFSFQMRVSKGFNIAVH